MKNATLAVIGVVIVVVGLVLSGAVFTVHQREQAIVLLLGDPQRVVQEPGLHFKIPLAENVVSFDRRVLDFDAPSEEVPTRDQKQLVVDSFARYRIIDPLRFLESVGTESSLEARLENVINANLRAVFGEVALATLLTPQRGVLMHNIAQRVKNQAQSFGINVLDVRIKHVDLPEENSQAIFRRMQTQREQEARKIRAEGDKESRRIRADADRQSTIIRANAERQSQILRGEGDEEAQSIYNDAHGKDRDFFDFWVSMNAMRESLSGKSTSYIGPPEGDFFRFFGNENGTPPATEK